MKKVFLIYLLPIVFMFVLFSNSKCFASIVIDENTVYPDVPSQYSDMNFVILVSGDNKNLLLFDDLKGNPFIEGNNIRFKNSKDEYGTMHWFMMSGDHTDNWSFMSDTTFLGSISSSKFLYSTVNIMESSDSDKVFFKPPQTLAPVVATIKMKTVLQEILGILPIMIIVLVGLIGLRKGLALLFLILRQS